MSNYGNVRSIKRNPIILKGDYQNNGYKRVYLWKNGRKKNLLIHRLVALSFLPNTKNYTDVNHIDEDKENNCASNLEWCSHKYNMNYGSIKQKIGKSNTGRVISEETREKLRRDTINRRWINNLIIEKYVNKNELQLFLSNGWRLGRLNRRKRTNDRKSKSIPCG